MIINSCVLSENPLFRTVLRWKSTEHYLTSFFNLTMSRAPWAWVLLSCLLGTLRLPSCWTGSGEDNRDHRPWGSHKLFNLTKETWMHAESLRTITTQKTFYLSGWNRFPLEVRAITSTSFLHVASLQSQSLRINFTRGISMYSFLGQEAIL